MQVTGPDGNTYTVGADNSVTDANNVQIGYVDAASGSFVDNSGNQTALSALADAGFQFPDTYELAPQSSFESSSVAGGLPSAAEPASPYEVLVLPDQGSPQTGFVGPMQSAAYAAWSVAEQLTDTDFVAANPGLASAAAAALKQLAEAYDTSPEAIQPSIDYWTSVAQQALAQGTWLLPDITSEPEPAAVRVTGPDGHTYTVGADNSVTDANNVQIGYVDTASGAFVDNAGARTALADIAGMGFQFPEGYALEPAANESGTAADTSNTAAVVKQFFAAETVPFRAHPDPLSELPAAIRAQIEAGGTLAGHVFLVTDKASPAIFDSPYGAFPLAADAVPGLAGNPNVFLAKTPDREAESGVFPGTAVGYAVLDERHAGWTQVPVYALTEINDVIDEAARAQGVPDNRLQLVRDSLFKYDPSFGVLVPTDVASAATALFGDRHESGSFFDRLMPAIVGIGIGVVTAGAGAGVAAAMGITGIGATAVSTGVAAAVSTTMADGNLADFATNWAAMFVGGQAGGLVGDAASALSSTAAAGLNAVTANAVAQLISSGAVDERVLLGAGAGAAAAGTLAGGFSPTAQPIVDGAARAAAIYLATGDRDAAVSAFLNAAANGAVAGASVDDLIEAMSPPPAHSVIEQAVGDLYAEYSMRDLPLYCYEYSQRLAAQIMLDAADANPVVIEYPASEQYGMNHYAVQIDTTNGPMMIDITADQFAILEGRERVGVEMKTREQMEQDMRARGFQTGRVTEISTLVEAEDAP